MAYYIVNKDGLKEVHKSISLLISKPSSRNNVGNRDSNDEQIALIGKEVSEVMVKQELQEENMDEDDDEKPDIDLIRTINQLPEINSNTARRSKSLSTGFLPAREDYLGPYRFTVLLDPGPKPRKSVRWEYSTKLSKLYIQWNVLLPVQFQWTPVEKNLSVRATPVYLDAQDMRSPVLRCLLHSHSDDPSNEGFEHVNHVIRSENPDAIYEEDLESKRCSVVVPLGTMQPGTDTVTVTYKFMCKTTCVTGMMRRPILVIFTLERPNGEVLGRQKLTVKVCSCPTRDMNKEERYFTESYRVPISGGMSLSDPVELMDRHNKSPPRRDVRRVVKLTKSGRIIKFRNRRIVPSSTSSSNSQNSTTPGRFIIELDDDDLMKSIMEFLHGGVCSLIRNNGDKPERYNKLLELRDSVEKRISELRDD